MKIWQLCAVLLDETLIFDNFFHGIDIVEKGRDDIEDELVLDALSRSSKRYYVTSHNYLRLMPEDDYLIKRGIYLKEELSAVAAYKKFGGNAITEVIDYGCFDLSKDDAIT